MRTTERRGANHGLHLVLTLLTCGLWAVTGWPIATALGRKTTTRVHGGHGPPQGPHDPRPPVQPPGWYRQ